MIASSVYYPTHRLSPEQIGLIGSLHSAAREQFQRSVEGMAALPLVILVLLAALAVEFNLLLHTMKILLDPGTGEAPSQPIMFLALSSFIAIIALHILTRQVGGEKLDRAMMSFGVVALVLFLLGFGLILSMTNFDIASRWLLQPPSSTSQIDAVLGGPNADGTETSLAIALRNGFGEFGNLTALIFVSLGLGGVFFLSVIVSHFLIGKFLKITGNFLIAKNKVDQSGRLKDAILEADERLGKLAQRLEDFDNVTPDKAVGDAANKLMRRATAALSHSRRILQAAKLSQPDKHENPLSALGAKILGIPNESGTINLPVLEEQINKIDAAIGEDVIHEIAEEEARREIESNTINQGE